MSLLSRLGLGRDATPLEVGAQAPDVAVQDVQGVEIQLGRFYQQGHCLVYFYPKAATPGCTKQACSLRDGFEALQNRGLTIVGVSGDRPAALRHFQKKLRLPFTLVSDAEGKAARAFGVPSILGMYHRQSFLVHNLKIVWRDLHASTSAQAADVLKVLTRERG